MLKDCISIKLHIKFYYLFVAITSTIKATNAEIARAAIAALVVPYKNYEKR
jgi:hypothetical protein